VLAAAGWSQDTKAADEAEGARLKAAGPRTSAPSYSSGLWDYWLNVVVPAHGWLDLDSAMDFSHADNVRVTIRCGVGNLTDLLLAAYWTVPQAPFFNVSDVVRGDSFYYRNVGGATFRTYGSRFRLRIVNNGATDVMLSQALVFARSAY